MRAVDADAILYTHELEQKAIGKDWGVDDLATAIMTAPTIDAIPVEWFTEMIKACGMQGQISAVAAMNWVLDEWKATKDEWQKGQEERPWQQ